ncbi:carbon-nitrogen hydrolase family protein [uncultured Cocleimonas sp.]|uniref:carbon-nitrogen hydrolase family protein n=1 Tax=uncultured Cocleimonas sp. TaxID=1051587 RepID=UPI00262E85E5|nr:carbon-nitrogen hydrolase family protein [uncultured Cocleimonas sp.]
MTHLQLTRRQFNKWLAALALTAGTKVYAETEPAKNDTELKLLVAAIQMAPKLGDVQSNLKQAEHLIRQAQKEGAQWIVLPEMFTSAIAFHEDMLKAIQPLDGQTLQLLKSLSKEGNSVIGGSFLASTDKGVFNTFVLVFPNGSVVQHNKDSPTYWENCYYKGGNDDGVLLTPIGNVGSVLCWELIRSRTARRLLNKVKLVVGGSCWWTLPEDSDIDSPRWAANLKMIQDAPSRMARMLGVPVVHGSHAGEFEGFFSPELPDVPYDSSYLGEAMIVDAQGQVLASRSKDQGEGVVIAEVTISEKAVPTEAIPETFWIPKEMPEDWKQSWERWFASGTDYYELVTDPFLKDGIINEYEPPYLR